MAGQTGRAARLNAGKIIIIVLFFILPGGAGYSGWRDFRKLSDYLPARATITASRLAEGSARDAKGRATTTYTPLITYRYQVAGEDYESGRIWAGKSYADQLTAEDMLAKYTVGSTHTAYYNPANPGDSFLERTYSLNAFCAIGVLALIAGGLFFAVRSGERLPPSAQENIRSDRRMGLAAAGGLLLVGLCFGFMAFGSIRAARGDDAGSIRIFLGVFALVPAGMGLIVALLTRQNYRQERFLAAETGERQLQADGGYGENALLMAAFAVLWNGFVGGATYLFASTEKGLQPVLCLAPFWIAGAILLIAALRQAAVFFTAAPFAAELHADHLPSGGAAAVTISHRPRRPVANVEIRLEGWTRARRRTPGRLLHRQVVGESGAPLPAGEGWRATFAVRAPAAVSGVEVWKLVARASVSGAPDYEQGFPLRAGGPAPRQARKQPGQRRRGR
ncbi:MAG TPA: DUF3592 domain-containing protein [Herpetosiphonaceae bacterium]